MTNCPDDSGKKQSQQQAEHRTGDGYNDFVERGNLRQLRAIQVGFAFNDVHRSKLRQRNKTSEWQRSQRVLDAINCLLPNRFTKPNTEFLDVETPPPRREKMPNFVHHDEQVKNDEDLEQDEDDAGDMQNHVISRGLVKRWTCHSICRCKSFNLLPIAGTPALALAPTDRLPILHRDRGAQRAYADSSPLPPSPRFPEIGFCDLKTLPPRFRWRRSSPPALCRRSLRRGAPGSKLENRRSAEWKIPTSIASKNPVAVTSSAPDPARSRRTESGSTC